jgi:hypothetical protein
VEDVDHDLKIVQDDPLTGWESINRGCTNRVILLEPRLNLLSDGFQMWFGSGRAKHEKIGKGRYPAEIQQENLLRLLVCGEFGASLR